MVSFFSELMDLTLSSFFNSVPTMRKYFLKLYFFIIWSFRNSQQFAASFPMAGDRPRSIFAIRRHAFLAGVSITRWKGVWSRMTCILAVGVDPIPPVMQTHASSCNLSNYSLVLITWFCWLHLSPSPHVMDLSYYHALHPIYAGGNPCLTRYSSAHNDRRVALNPLEEVPLTTVDSAYLFHGRFFGSISRRYFISVFHFNCNTN